MVEFDDNETSRVEEKREHLNNLSEKIQEMAWNVAITEKKKRASFHKSYKSRLWVFSVVQCNVGVAKTTLVDDCQ